MLLLHMYMNDFHLSGVYICVATARSRFWPGACFSPGANPRARSHQWRMSNGNYHCCLPQPFQPHPRYTKLFAQIEQENRGEPNRSVQYHPNIVLFLSILFPGFFVVLSNAFSSVQARSCFTSSCSFHHCTSFSLTLQRCFL